MLLLPLTATLCSFLSTGSMLGRYTGHRGAVVMSIFCLSVAALSSAVIWVEACWGGSESWLDLWGVWFEVGSFQIGWKLCGDLLTSQMLFTVTSVSLAVHLYAVIYMRADPHLNLFISYLSLFTFFMLVLVTADNLVLMLVGWEGIGVCSYLLIGYWSHRLSAVKSAGKAILVNRISDGMLMWGILWIWYHTGALEYDLVLLVQGQGFFLPEPNLVTAPQSLIELSQDLDGDVEVLPITGSMGGSYAGTFSSLMLVSVLVGAMGKSAQILFHVWLADAMEGPTPVSALIHAATLVTAGVYLMVRLSPFWDELVLLVGCLTAFMAGVFGYFQSDLKRVIAFSTCSQLGYMMVSVSLGEVGAEGSLSHLMTHASFKAALFLAAGLVIGVSDSHQHVARYGALSGVHTSLFCYTTLVLASLSLVGWPELSGFYSKETILNLSYNTGHALADVAHTLLLITAFLTSCYSAKLIFQGFILDYSGRLDSSVVWASHGKAPLTEHHHYSNPAVNLLPTLAMSLLLFDILLKIWVGTNLLSGILPFVPWGVKTLPFGLVVSGILSALAGTALWMNSPVLVRLCGTRWGFDQIFARLLVNATLDWGRLAWSGVERAQSIQNLNY